MCKFRDFEKYEIYEDGRIWSYKRNKFLKPRTDTSGYKQVVLYDNEGKGKNYLLHRVVYESVTREPIPEGFEINHISEAKDENFFANLQLVSHKENVNFGTRNARTSKTKTNNTKTSKSVGAFKDGKLYMVFPSTKEAQRQGFYSAHICDCCNGKRNTHKGYTWKYL